MLFFADDLWNALAAEIVERLGGMFQQPRQRGRTAGRHSWRQVDQPFRIGGESAHHLQRSGGILLSDRDGVVQSCRDDSFSENVFGVKNVVLKLLSRQR